jgi:hypothetical protein
MAEEAGGGERGREGVKLFAPPNGHFEFVCENQQRISRFLI